MDINEIQDLIKFVAKAGVNEVEIEKKDFKIVIKSDYLAKKKTNFKEETTIVQQQIPMGMSAPMPAAPVVEAPVVAAAKKRGQ
jgi:acetyl-CoA carboxylase biotin carboxyl carrier protein